MQTMCLMTFWQSKYLRNFYDLVGKNFTPTNTFAKSEQIPQIDCSPMKRSRWSAGTWEYTQSQQSGKHDSVPLRCNLTPVAVAFTNTKENMSGWKDVQQLRAAFSEDLGSVPSTFVRRCPPVCNSDINDYTPCSDLLSIHMDAHICKHRQTHGDYGCMYVCWYVWVYTWRCTPHIRGAKLPLPLWVSNVTTVQNVFLSICLLFWKARDRGQFFPESLAL